ncbi:hypothetical protein BDV95DRAFT_574227 [Massariosphaeria phaeospora]|uniref:Rhodopsin domain-containing protein n=1 Tax=Massariosphaeria phaeospora TaxID=100035 RepID=A0A7C8I4F8_9PLEO|nr:hypothetical protein BDV95DRAFT_574227 [Massariosphaeria phaeospora]
MTWWLRCVHPPRIFLPSYTSRRSTYDHHLAARRDRSPRHLVTTMVTATHPKSKFPGVLPPPPGVTPNIHFQQSGWNLLTQITCIAVTTIFIILRLWAKRLASLKFHADDWVSVGAWASCTLYCSLCLATGPLGLGIHMWNVTPQKFSKFFEIGYVIEVFYGPVAFITKLAILLLLMRIFSIKKTFVVSVKILIGVLALYYIAITLVKIFICKPVEKFWNHTVPGTCLNTNTIFISDCIIALITDFVILATPLPVIWGLQMDVKKKLGSSFALVVGAIACVASILRLDASIKTMDDLDKSYIFEPILLYSSGEIAIGVICGCIPMMPALYRHYRTRVNRHFGWTTNDTYASSKNGMSGDSYKGMVPLRNIPSTDSAHRTVITSNGKSMMGSRHV